MIGGRLGIVPYTNAKPLQFGLRERLPEGSLIEAPPSELAAMLDAGALLAAIVSSFACFSRRGLRVVPDICIASDGPVLSVKLFFFSPVAEARRVGLHTASLSSSAMARIVLRETFGIDPEFVAWPTEDRGTRVDGYLLIGDAAMTHPDAPIMIDLGEEWRKLTGLPFVYAVWGVAREGKTKGLRDLLLDARRGGIENVEAIAEAESKRLSLDKDLCLRYLTEVIHFDLGEREIEGLDVFAKKCRDHGLVPKGAAIEFLS